MNVEEAEKLGLFPLIESISFNLDAPEWELSEAAEGTVSSGGTKVLGFVRGPFFVVEGLSDNNRWYSRQLWEKVISENFEAHGNGSVVGTIGHDQELDDKALREGKGSHIVTRLWFPENESKKTSFLGHGEVAILDTSVGRELFGYLNGGLRLDVSSRAFGRYVGKKNGADIVDPDTFRYEGFDFTRKGGVRGATPSLVEDSKHITNIPENKEKRDVSKENDMNDENKDMTKVLETLSKEKNNIQTDLDTALTSNDELKGKLAVAENRVGELTQSLEEYKKVGTVAAFSDALTKATELGKFTETQKGELVQALETLKAFEALGTPEDLAKALDEAKKLGEAIEELGNISDLNTALDTLEEFAQLGTKEKLEESLALLVQFEELGSVEDISEAFEKTKLFVEEVKELGTVEELNSAIDILEKYIQLGTPEDITEAFDLTDRMVEAAQDEKFKADVKEVAEALGIETATAENLLKKMTKKDALALVNELKGEFGLKVSEEYLVHDDGEALDESAPGEEKVKVKPMFEGTRASRLQRSMSK